MSASRFATVLFWLAGSVLGLRDIQIAVPEAVGVGATATLGCRWSLETGETLYTVKWYHGAQEFFRFVPKELPNTRVFSQTGISVDVSKSGAQQVVLREAARALSGRYRCEVSADAPFFHTVYKSAFMRVVELPESAPVVRAQKGWYSSGDMLRANCSSPPADPPANLTWLLNGHEVKGLDIPVMQPAHPIRRKVDASLEDANRIIFSPWETGHEDTTTVNVFTTQDSLDSRRNFDTSPNQPGNKSINTEEEKSNKSSTFSQLVVRVQATHFHKSRLNVTCVARVGRVWSATAALLLDEERPQLAPVMGSRDSNSGFHGSKCQMFIALTLNTIVYLFW